MHYKYCRRGDILNFLFDKKKAVTCDIKLSQRKDLLSKEMWFDGAAAQEQNFTFAQSIQGCRGQDHSPLLRALAILTFRTRKKHHNQCWAAVALWVLPTLITASQTGHPLLQCQSTRTFLVWLLGAPQHVQWARNYHQPKCNNLLTVLSLIVLFMIHINWHLALILSCSPFSEQLLLLSYWSTRSIKSFHRVLRGYIIYFSLRKSARFITLQMHTSQK